ncbi:dTDP-4-amino-4,6-dideoxygalactose transaminase [Terracoccus luteus]|uniref:dTDP-4-amino-4,6-dideoxygalactose transaminase n=1 Tax=Terracoccus luteus TaxID=53356 RepID=A0A495XZQ3_9MICO|nr:aminotransferase class I/II-fold pyridoxal phosphate-dependent enzyme [Terracoccus luteus]MBB2987376.1 dTDP-4-amino-4,6-dideoxygalactose transaminase [Terracoccus luteus]MCP2173027.1 dTDP-4-amino-4,6-dideoxygalactose transaminase [Terracoccus luteus]RKT79777.1 dTDP-4-amino-4,6-dideoxygalactose transaminase [Terracoccus luteus]
MVTPALAASLLSPAPATAPSATPPVGRIHLSKAEVTEVEEAYVLDALRSGWIAPLGPHVDAFEAEVAELVGVAGALALSSGTAALHLALLDAGVGPGDVVPLSSLTFAATVNAVVYTGARPVFVDSRASDGNVDVDLLVDAVDTLRSEGHRVPAVLPVDLLGRCVDYTRLLPAMDRRGVVVVEDAAEALGARHAGGGAGSFGRSAAISFNGNKIMTTSGGGMLLSDDLELLARARYLSTQARHPVPWYEHTEVGYNYRLSNLLAALGRGQLERLPSMIDRRRAIRARYAEALAPFDDVRLLGRSDGDTDADDNCWLTTVVLDRPGATVADDLVTALTAADIEARHVWKPMHRQPVFACDRAFVTGGSDELFRTGVTLPSGASLRDDEVERVVDELVGYLGR